MPIAVSIAADNDLLRIVGQHYGSGEIYLTSRRDLPFLKLAIERGLVSADGYVTPSGRRAWTGFLLNGSAPPLPAPVVSKHTARPATLPRTPTVHRQVRSQ